MSFEYHKNPVYSLVSGMVYADGDETVSAVADLISGVGNIILSVILSHFLGIEGLGLASFIKPYCALWDSFYSSFKKNAFPGS